jgi:hypothetical protein
VPCSGTVLWRSYVTRIAPGLQGQVVELQGERRALRCPPIRMKLQIHVSLVKVLRIGPSSIDQAGGMPAKSLATRGSASMGEQGVWPLMILSERRRKTPSGRAGGYGRPVMHTAPPGGDTCTSLRYCDSNHPGAMETRSPRAWSSTSSAREGASVAGPGNSKRPLYDIYPAARASGLFCRPVAGFDSSQSHASFVQIYLPIREHEWWIFAGEEVCLTRSARDSTPRADS